jgi:STAS domain
MHRGHCMSSKTFQLPEVVDLSSARSVAADLMRHIDTSPRPAVDAAGLRQGGVPLLQVLVAARHHADGRGKPFTVKADRDGVLAKLLSTYALDPVLCGAAADLLPPAAGHFTKRS